MSERVTILSDPVAIPAANAWLVRCRTREDAVPNAELALAKFYARNCEAAKSLLGLPQSVSNRPAKQIDIIRSKLNGVPLTSAQISKACGIDHRNVATSLRLLIERNEASRNGERGSFTYCLKIPKL